MKTVIISILIVCLIDCRKPRGKFQSSETLQAEYFAVTARDGLNLRAAPEVTAKKLLTLPYLHRGRILEKTEKIHEIQGAKGYWLKTEFRGTTGWAFSGFVWLLKNETDSINVILDEKQEFSAASPPELVDLEEIKPSSNESLPQDILGIFDGQQFSVQLSKPATNDYCEGRPVVMKSKASNQYYRWLVDESGMKNITPTTLSSELFVYATLGLWCSCGAHDVTGIILLGETPQLLQVDKLDLQEWATRCEAWEGWVPSHTQARFNISDRMLYLLLKAPVCKHENQGREYKAYSTGRHTGWFMVYEKRGKKYVESARINAIEVPELYKESWKNAAKL